ncbi:hypothetical protein DY000_02048649 [Brassica cretica]|uniref:DUF4005 domain-containing protein n=1 Tax=Brassica cretica TaxID=69181 RepID=A0ABQ7F018_BRACR|nr:hypothetical protein DY000_02048649 [Brassica cretica]
MGSLLGSHLKYNVPEDFQRRFFTKSLAVKSRSNLNRTKYRLSKGTDSYPNRPRASSSMAIGPWTSQARSLRSDRARAKARSLRSDRDRAKAWSLRNDRARTRS